jgi:hypothetical protein
MNLMYITRLIGPKGNYIIREELSLKKWRNNSAGILHCSANYTSKL